MESPLIKKLKIKPVHRELVLEFHRNGKLFDMHKIIAERLHLYGAEMCRDGHFYLDEKRVSDNTLYCLLRRDIESRIDAPTPVIRSLFEVSVRYLRSKKPLLENDERALIVSTFDVEKTG